MAFYDHFGFEARVNRKKIQRLVGGLVDLNAFKKSSTASQITTIFLFGSFQPKWTLQSIRCIKLSCEMTKRVSYYLNKNVLKYCHPKDHIIAENSFSRKNSSNFMHVY